MHVCIGNFTCIITGALKTFNLIFNHRKMWSNDEKASKIAYHKPQLFTINS